MSERKLPSRRRRAPQGRVIRVSNAVYDALDGLRSRRSWDWLFRRMLGLPDRAGNAQPLVEGMLEAHTGKFLLKSPELSWNKLEEDAYEVAILSVAKTKLKRVERPLRMRQIP